MPSSKTQRDISDKDIKHVLGISRDELDSAKETLKKMQSRADMIQTIERDREPMSDEEFTLHLINVLNAMSVFGASRYDLFEAVTVSLTQSCKAIAEELNNQ
tara:strand:+ start:587 stop:892 length:306 start_codon:yes stop_codon:yes gene_type:complete